mmetsp:Transcript_21264/g.30457  ORF Transcript_21264/g.30457 Transcript_21264/m.30457 type:complete len:85 (-) Transcript_21264:85-339(-)
MSFLSRKTKQSVSLTKDAISVYRSCIRLLKYLEPMHRKTWYDYTRLKYDENKLVTDEKKISRILTDAKEQVCWMSSIIERKKDR